MRFKDIFHKIAAFFRKNKGRKRNYSIRNIDISFFDIPHSAYLVIKKYGWVTFFCKTARWVMKFSKRYLKKIKILYRDAITSFRNEGSIKVLKRITNYIFFGKGFLRENNKKRDTESKDRKDPANKYLENDFRFYEEQNDYSKRIKHRSIKILSYYLPQFHPIPENDKWHGDGFTEWHKVRGANPLFYGHYQQHVPHEDIGYYLLDSPIILKKQADMMKKAGIFGQIFYHYWFTGKLILEKPAQMLLENKDIEMPFCFCWANENWTKKWDGNEKEILLGQDYSKEDAAKFIKYLIPFFKDERYIKISGRPVLFIYRSASFPNFKIYKEIWANECIKNGLPRPYLVATLTRGVTNPSNYNMDAAVERVLHDWTDGNVSETKNELVQYSVMNGSVLQYDSVADYYISKEENNPFVYFRSIVPNWDNTARYGENASLLYESTPGKFQSWLKYLINWSKIRLRENERFIIVNAWNEWAEGAHLEPDTKFGYAYLNSIGRALSDVDYDCSQLINVEIPENINIKITFSQEVLVILKNNVEIRDKFIYCIANSTIFDLCNVLIIDDDIANYLKVAKNNLRINEEKKDFGYVLFFGAVSFFVSDMIEQLLKTGIENNGSVICANSFYSPNAHNIERTENCAINNNDAFPIKLFPNQTKIYKNYKISINAICTPEITDLEKHENPPRVTAIIRFHKNADFRLLKNAFLSLFSQSGCIVQPLIAAQDLSNDQLSKLDELLAQYAWHSDFRPIVRIFRSKDGNADLRSRMMNESLKSVKTRFATFLDYDDIVFPFAYKWLISRIKTTNKTVSFGNVFIAEFNRKNLQIIDRKRNFEWGVSYKDFINDNHSPLHGFMIDVSKINLAKIKYYEDMKYMEDYYLTMQIITKENTDWDSLKFKKYIGDYMYSLDGDHTLSTLNEDKKKIILKDELYQLCEKRIRDLREKIMCDNSLK